MKQPQSTGISHKLNMKGPLAVYLLTLFFLLSSADLLNLCLNNDVKMGAPSCLTPTENDKGFQPKDNEHQYLADLLQGKRVTRLEHWTYSRPIQPRRVSPTSLKPTTAESQRRTEHGVQE
uniref:Uncharacterized protein n=1 Tax=Knipowitschia caucasica TaxID=637954 RepID=A0AAV2L9J4_KNICA